MKPYGMRCPPYIMHIIVSVLSLSLMSGISFSTGILPIAKYSSGSELNMFLEYTMASEEMYGEYFGFTEKEVDELYARFALNQKNPAVSREGLRLWYDGYYTKQGVREYAATSMNLTTKDEIFSAMVVYGFLTYQNGHVYIPNKEVLECIQEILIESEN